MAEEYWPTAQLIVCNASGMSRLLGLSFMAVEQPTKALHYGNE